jgi:23S rRNA pseudouridine1911/1915/1917 synthase
MTSKSITVPSSIPFPARRLASVLQNLFAIPASHSAWLIENGCVSVNQRLCRKGSHRLEPGDLLDVDWVPMPVKAPPPRKGTARNPIEFLYDDPHLCVVNKPAHLLTVPTRYGEGQTLVSRVQRRLRDTDPQAEVFCVHRLDRDVSGVLLLAKSLTIAEKIRDQFAQRKPERKYIAIVAGHLEPRSGTVTSYLATDQNLNRFSVKDSTQGELAITHYRTRTEWNDTSLVEVRLETGRRNQIRVHLAEAGHPILGDPRYRPTQASHWAWPHRRIALHGETLGIVHPITEEPMLFDSPWPQEFRDFQRSVARMRSARGGRNETRDGQNENDEE